MSVHDLCDSGKSDLATLVRINLWRNPRNVPAFPVVSTGEVKISSDQDSLGSISPHGMRLLGRDPVPSLLVLLNCKSSRFLGVHFESLRAAYTLNPKL